MLSLSYKVPRAEPVGIYPVGFCVLKGDDCFLGAGASSGTGCDVRGGRARDRNLVNGSFRVIGR